MANSQYAASSIGTKESLSALTTGLTTTATTSPHVDLTAARRNRLRPAISRHRRYLREQKYGGSATVRSLGTSRGPHVLSASHIHGNCGRRARMQNTHDVL